jgi:hypothetical protein
MTQVSRRPYKHTRWHWPPATTTSIFHPPHVPLALHDLNTIWIPVREIHCMPSNSGRWIKMVLPHPQLGQTYDRSIRPNGKQFIWQLEIGPGRARPGRVRVTGLPIDLLLGLLHSGLHWLRPKLELPIRHLKASIHFYHSWGSPVAMYARSSSRSTNVYRLDQYYTRYDCDATTRWR